MHFSKKLNVGAYFWLTLLGLFLAPGVYVIVLLLSGKIEDENGVLLPLAFQHGMALLFLIVLSSYFITVLSLLRQMIGFRCAAMTVDETGIHNTFIFLNLLCFTFVGRIKLIPWCAVTDYAIDEDGMMLRVAYGKVEGSFLGRLLVWIMGYSFCRGMAKQNFDEPQRLFVLQEIRKVMPNASDFLL